MSDGGKGDKRRKAQISRELADARWDLAFGNEEQKKAALKKIKEIEERNT